MSESIRFAGGYFMAFALWSLGLVGCEQEYAPPEMREAQLVDFADSVGIQVIALGESPPTAREAVVTTVRVDLGRPPPDVAEDGWCPLFSELQATLEGHPMEVRWLGDRQWRSFRHPGWCIWPSFKIKILEFQEELVELDQLVVEVFDSSHRVRLVSGNFIRPVTFSLRSPASGEARAGDTLQIAIDPTTAIPPDGPMSFTQSVLNPAGRLEDYYPLGVQEVTFLEPNVFEVLVPRNAVVASDYPVEEGYRWMFEEPAGSGYSVPNGWSVQIERCDAGLGCTVSRNSCGTLAQPDYPCDVGDWFGVLDSPFVDLRVVP